MNALHYCAKCNGSLTELAGLDAAGRVLCSDCYLADPPREDVDGVFAEVAAHMDTPAPPKRVRKPRKAKPEARAALLTELGEALGCSQVGLSRPRANSTDNRFAACYYTGPLSELGPAEPRPTKVDTGTTRMDVDARELARQGRADLLRFFSVKAAFKRRQAMKAAS